VSWMNHGDADIEIPGESRYFNSCWSIAKSQNMIQKHSKQNQTEAILPDQLPGWELNCITCSSALKLLSFPQEKSMVLPRLQNSVKALHLSLTESNKRSLFYAGVIPMTQAL
jgi:hypothetical protein